jgi:hypothetical protein
LPLLAAGLPGAAGCSRQTIRRAKSHKSLSPHDPAEFLFYDIGSAAYMNAGRFDSGLVLARRLIALFPTYYFGYLWCAANAAGAERDDEARAFIAEARRIQPDVSMTLVRQSLGAMAPEVDERLARLLGRAGLPT